MDDFNSLWNRLLGRVPSIGATLAQQYINDSWHELQSKREWSWRRRGFVIAPPNLYSTGQASTNVANGNPNLITGIGTNWDPTMVGRQIRIGGLLYPFYDITGFLSPTSLLIGQPWAGVDVTAQTYNILQIYYPVPDDFGYFYVVVSIKDAMRLWLTPTQADLAILDPQRTNFGQTYAVVFKDYTPQFGGSIGPVIPVTSLIDPAPISTTSLGYSFVADSTFVIQIVTGGTSGTATYQWFRTPQVAFQPPVLSSDVPTDLSDGVQIYFPDGVTYVSGDIFIINCRSQVTSGVPRFELWPGPTFAAYLYPAIYIAKETDLSFTSPSLPPFIANRGEVLIEMAHEKACTFAGQDADHMNLSYSLKDALYHQTKWKDMLVDIERNDEEISESNITYDSYPFYPAPWATGQWQQEHAPFLPGY